MSPQFCVNLCVALCTFCFLLGFAEEEEHVEEGFLISLYFLLKLRLKRLKALVEFALEKHRPFMFSAVKPPPSMSQQNKADCAINSSCGHTCFSASVETNYRTKLST